MAAAVRALLTAVADDTPPAAEIGARITAAIRANRYQPGVSLAASVIAADLQVPVAPVRLAFTDLTTTGVLERSGQRTAVPATGEEETERAQYLAARLRSQMAYGLYPPESTLPKGPEMARIFVTNDPVVRGALGFLEMDGLIYRRPARPPLVLDAAGCLSPSPRSAPHPDEPVQRRFSVLQIQTSVAAAYARWHKRPYVPASEAVREWQQLRAMARQLLKNHPVPPRAGRSPRAAAAVRAREVESAPLPETTLLALWHTACLAASVGDLL
ncbi:GntR family transcriptional regulator [Streptomyces sp. NPDC048272]|uniref:GntR family transcriptional regulator n=1 Tax=Streptomyces sp. NPDC048272 TaxID=3154616 RepID=UPI00341AD693